MKNTRREFIKDLAVAGIAAAGGCRSLCGCGQFYGETIRDRLWMWGHHPDMSRRSFPRNSAKIWPGPTVDQAEGCRMMGIPNDCVIRWGNMPEHPWGNYFEQFHSLKRISFGIADGAKGSVKEKMRIAFEEIQPNFPNLTGCFLDDDFRPANIGQKGLDLQKVAAEVHAHNLRLSVVLYSDQDGFRQEFKHDLECCDETSLWFWRSDKINTMADRVKECREFIGSEKDLLLGLNMWDFTLGEPVSAERMAVQLDCARRFLADRTVTGLIFHPSFAAALDVPAVKLSKEWIHAYGEDRWGV